MQTELMYRKTESLTSQQLQQQNLALMASSSAPSSTSSTPQHQARGIARRDGDKKNGRDTRETIHSGHFMVSDFEAEAQDDEDELAVPVPEEQPETRLAIVATNGAQRSSIIDGHLVVGVASVDSENNAVTIETSLNKLFQCMSLAYRQKLTSPKWNRFKGIRLRWKDKIRLNNCIWRCWHMQFIIKKSSLACQFASPLDVNTHDKPEAVVLEGKYWKRKLAAVTAEYKKWRMFYRNRIFGWPNRDGVLEAMDTMDWGDSGWENSLQVNNFGGGPNMISDDSMNMMVDEDYMQLMTDTLFTTIGQPIYFPDTREIARGVGLADLIQPSLGPLQPTLDDFINVLEPLQEYLTSKIPMQPEDDVYGQGAASLTATSYPEIDLLSSMNQVPSVSLSGGTVSSSAVSPILSIATTNQHQPPSMQTDESVALQNLQYTAKMYTQAQQQQQQQQLQQMQQQNSSLFSNNSNLNQNFNITSQNFEHQQVQKQQALPMIREKSQRQSRGHMRASKLNAHQQTRQQSQQSTYQLISQPQPQQLAYQRDFRSLDLQSTSLGLDSNQLQLVMTEANSQTLMNSSEPIFSTAQAHDLGSSYTEPPQVKQMKQDISHKPYTKRNPPGYKFSPPTGSFDAQQCKFTSNLRPTMPATQMQQQQSVVTRTSQQTPQSHILIQPNNAMDYRVSTFQSPKLLPRPPNSQVVEAPEEVFAVPKYQKISKNRSRSSSLNVIKNAPKNVAIVQPGPLIATVSDPTLNVNSNTLLTQLLSKNPGNLYAVTSAHPSPDQRPTSQNQSVIGAKHILPVSTTNVTARTQNIINAPHHINTSTTLQPIHTITSVHDQTQQQTNSNQAMLVTTNLQSPSQSGSNPNSPNDSSSNAPGAVHSPQSLSLSPLHSPMNVGSPLSPSRNYVRGESERGQYREQRRVGHIHAEQKRRCNIKNGFDTLYNLIPQLNSNPNTKMSKAAMLQKGADYIRTLRSERHIIRTEVNDMKLKLESLNQEIACVHNKLPAEGAPVTSQRSIKMKEMFDEYVKLKTHDNWKFWIFSVCIQPLFDSFNASVSTTSMDDLCETTKKWAGDKCSLAMLRPALLMELRDLSKRTNVVYDATSLAEAAIAAVGKLDNPNPRNDSMQG
ncbi:carbohydrate-responsive element-binding protein [Trichogramma pretiosum]|uniref:carbohydrate-responsive element-binding protein n=1 Tax=Trichogramma pretiosum TaxID=7493 RepID=UPI000C71C709|nr:carbohydrate-responsive element-binding protein [Trichogramma pretiosum]